MTFKRSGARLWLLAFIGFWLLHAGWALATPYNGVTDEREHTLRAAGVMHGEIVPEQANNGGLQTVPESLDRKFCYQFKPGVTPSCVPEPGGAETQERAHTTAARFNPLYYAVTGWPIGLWPDWAGIMLTRLLTGAAMAALLACAVVAAARWTRNRALLTGIVVALTPMTAHLGGAVNPNGVEIAAGVALFVALIALLHEEQEGINRAAVALAGASACVLVTPRFTGLMWVVVIMGVMLIPSSRARLRQLAKARVVRGWAAAVAVATLASLAWTILVKPADPAAMAYDHGYGTMQILRTAIVDDIWPNIANQMVGVTGWTDLLMPRLVYVAWFMAAGLLLLGALALGSRVQRFRLLLLFFGVFGPLLLSELLTVNQIGWITQGRYFLTGAVGLPILAAYIISRRGFTAEHMRSATRLFAVLLLPIQLVCLLYSMSRWNSGLQSLNPYNGSWQPPYGTTITLLSMTLGVLVLFAMYWWASRLPAEPPAAEQEEEETVTAAVPAKPAEPIEPVEASYV